MIENSRVKLKNLDKAIVEARIPGYLALLINTFIVMKLLSPIFIGVDISNIIKIILGWSRQRAKKS